MRRIATARTTVTAKYKRQLRRNRTLAVRTFNQVLGNTEKANEL